MWDLLLVLKPGCVGGRGVREVVGSRPALGVQEVVGSRPGLGVREVVVCGRSWVRAPARAIVRIVLHHARKLETLMRHPATLKTMPILANYYYYEICNGLYFVVPRRTPAGTW